jgi:hypothetical protein
MSELDGSGLALSDCVSAISTSAKLGADCCKCVIWPLSSFCRQPCRRPRLIPFLARHFRRRQIRPRAFRDDLALLLECPNTASFATRDDLNLRYADTLTTYRTGILSRIGLRNQSRRCVHARLPSRHGPVPPCVAAAALTESFMKSLVIVSRCPSARLVCPCQSFRFQRLDVGGRHKPFRKSWRHANARRDRRSVAAAGSSWRCDQSMICAVGSPFMVSAPSGEPASCRSPHSPRAADPAARGTAAHAPQRLRS